MDLSFRWGDIGEVLENRPQTFKRSRISLPGLK